MFPVYFVSHFIIKDILPKTWHKVANVWRWGFHAISHPCWHPSLSFFPAAAAHSIRPLSSQTPGGPQQLIRTDTKGKTCHSSLNLRCRWVWKASVIQEQFIWGEGILHFTCISVVRYILISNYNVKNGHFRICGMWLLHSPVCSSLSFLFLLMAFCAWWHLTYC